MTKNLVRLTTIGFMRAGKWMLEKEALALDLDVTLAREEKVLYAFAVNGVLMYVGKTTMALRERMQRYKTPSKNAERGGSTNIKNNRNIVEALVNGDSVDIFVLLDPGQQTHGGFVVSLAAGLEDSLIGELSPPWNGVRLLAANNPIVAERMMSAATSHADRKNSVTGARLNKIDFELVLRQMLADGADSGESYIDVNAGALHRRVGGYPAAGHVMPTCCGVMRAEMMAGDDVLAEPPKGKGASLSIRYRLPRV